ncbi:golgin subfamily A member 6-like protein 22 [Thunnus thynnus]|uniref:golgin subfamily A member 6-like protein 22 n=1 Tax=Thunnus thynnus TaxID=8237 RepID=UPI003527F8D0
MVASHQEHIEYTKRKEKMMSRYQIQLKTEIVKGIRELTPEERRKELRREMFRELREMEMERRKRASLEVLQKCKNEREERDRETERWRRQKEKHEEERRRQEAKHREEEERRMQEAKHREKEERRMQEAKHREEEERRMQEAKHREEEERRMQEAKHREEEERRMQEAKHREEEERRMQEAKHREEEEKRGQEAKHREEEERRMQEAKHREEEEERRMQEAKHREEERRADEQMVLERQKQDQLKIDKLQWKWVMMGEEPVTSLKFSLSDLEKEQQRRHKEAELCHLQKVEDKASLKCLTSKLQGKEQSKRKTLREQKTDCETVEKEIHPHGSTHPPSAEKASPKTETTKAAKSYKSLLRVQERLRFEFWFEKHQDQRERKKEAHRLKAERRCAKQAACKESRWSNLSEQFDCYTEGFTMSRNSILKKSIF